MRLRAQSMDSVLFAEGIPLFGWNYFVLFIGKIALLVYLQQGTLKQTACVYRGLETPNPTQIAVLIVLPLSNHTRVQIIPKQTCTVWHLKAGPWVHVIPFNSWVSKCTLVWEHPWEAVAKTQVQPPSINNMWNSGLSARVFPHNKIAELVLFCLNIRAFFPCALPLMT